MIQAQENINESVKDIKQKKKGKRSIENNNNKDNDEGKPINEINDPSINNEDDEKVKMKDDQGKRMQREDIQPTQGIEDQERWFNKEIINLQPIEQYKCPIHHYEKKNKDNGNDDQEKAKMILEAKSISIVVDDKKSESDANSPIKDTKCEEENNQQEQQKKEKQSKSMTNELTQSKNQNKLTHLTAKLLQLKQEYNNLLNSPLESEDKSINDQIASLNKEIENEIKMRKNLSLYLDQMNQQVNQQYSNATEKVIPPKVIKIPNITTTLLLKNKEETNLNKLTNILQNEAIRYESIYKQYHDPRVIEAKMSILDQINQKKKGLEEELLSLKKIFESHSKCMYIERKLEQKLRECRADHSDILVSFELEHKTYDRETNKTQIAKNQDRGKEGYSTIANKPRNKKPGKPLQSFCFDEYLKSFPSSLKDKKQTSHQSIWDNHTQLPQLTLFKPNEEMVLKELVPHEQLQCIESRFNAINENRRKIKQQLNQEMEYFKHTKEKIMEAHYENTTKMDREKRKSKLLILDLKKDESDAKTIKTRMKQLDKLISSIQSQCNYFNRANKDLKETINLLSTSAAVVA